MRRHIGLFLVLFSFLFLKSSFAQQPASPWDQLVPVMSFGYGGLSSVYWSPINGQLAAVSSTGFQFYNQDLTLQGERRFDQPLQTSAIFSPDMHYAALAEDGGLIVRDSATWLPVLALAQYNAPSWSPDSHLLAVWAADRLQIWDVEKAQVRREVTQLIASSVPVQWSPDSAVIAVPGPGAIVMLRVDTGDIVRIHAFDNIQAFDWSDDGKWLAIVGRKNPLPLDFDPEKQPILYDMLRVDALTGEVSMTYDVSAGESDPAFYFTAVGAPTVSPDGEYVAAQIQRVHFNESSKQWLYDQVGMGIWEFDSGTPLTVANSAYPPLPLSYVTWSPDGKRFASSGSNGAAPSPTFQGGQSSALQPLLDVLNEYGYTWTEDGSPLTLRDLQNLAASDPDEFQYLMDVYGSIEPSDSSGDAAPPTTTFSENTLVVYSAQDGTVVNNLPAYISSTGSTAWTADGVNVVAAGGLWDVSGALPTYVRHEDLFQEPDYYPNVDPNQGWENRYSFLKPDPLAFNYDYPPYQWRILQEYSDRGFVITYEIDIEYPGTPEYEDEIPPEERYILWDIASHKRLEEHAYLNEQTAWLYDLPNADERSDQNTTRNVIATTRLVVLGDDEIVDLRTGDEIPLEGVNRFEFREAWFRPDGTQIIAYDTDRRFKFFDPQSGKMIYQTEPADRAALHFTRDLSRAFLVDLQGSLRIYDATTGEQLLADTTSNYDPLLEWTADRTLLAVGGENRGIIIYDMPSQTRLGILRGHQAAITSIDFNAACDYDELHSCHYGLVSSDANGQVIIWGFPDQIQLANALPETPAEPSLSPPPAALNYRDLEPLWTYIAAADQVGRERAQTVGWSDDGIIINSGYYYTADLSYIENPPCCFDDWTGYVGQLPNGLTLLRDGRLFNSDGDMLAYLGSDHVYDAIFSSDGERILTAESDNRDTQYSGWIREWSPHSGLPITAWGGGEAAYNHIAFSPNGKWIATTTMEHSNAGGRGQIWYADQYNTRYSSLIGHTGTITGLLWDGDNVLTSSRDGSLRRWDIDTGEPVARWDHASRAPIQAMDWTENGSLLVSAGDDLYLLDPHTLAKRQVMEGIGGGKFAWSPDQAQLVVIGSDSVVRVIDFTKQEIAHEERRHMPPISHMAWRPDGAVIAVGRQDGSIILLDALTGDPSQTLRPYGAGIREMQWDAEGKRLLVDHFETDAPLEILDGSTGATLAQIDNPFRRKGLWWSPDQKEIVLATFPDPNMGVYDAPSLLRFYDAATGAPLRQFELDWSDFRWYWDKKPFKLFWSADNQQLAAFYGGRLRLWNLADGAMREIQYDDESNPPSLVDWDGSIINFWTVDGWWQADLSRDTVEQLSAQGLPSKTIARADRKVLLAGQTILDYATFYSLQDLESNFVDAQWHPSCWSEDCPAMLAVASGSSITMYSYPQLEQ